MSANMKNEQLISYCELHSSTPRALFSGIHINRMIELAGFPDSFPKKVDENDFFSMHESMKELCKLAKERLSNENS